MTKSPKRYDTEKPQTLWVREDGPWVLFEDYCALAAEHERIMAEKDAEIEEAYARGFHAAQKAAKISENYVDLFGDDNG